MSAAYEYTKRWRQEHPDKRNADRARYYDRYAGPATRSRLPWTQDEDAKVLARKVPDRVLAEGMGRTVRAIQIRRTRLQPGGAQ